MSCIQNETNTESHDTIEVKALPMPVDITIGQTKFQHRTLRTERHDFTVRQNQQSRGEQTTNILHPLGPAQLTGQTWFPSRKQLARRMALPPVSWVALLACYAAVDINRKQSEFQTRQRQRWQKNQTML